MSSLTLDDLTSALTGNPEALDVHLELVETDIKIDGLQVNIHCHCLVVDGNGKFQPQRLAEFMRSAITNYAIPKTKVLEAKERDSKYNSTEAVTALYEQAKKSFTDLKKSGEGGEMLLFLLAERFLKLPQILCKMDLKTDSRMHYHGADGVYAGVTSDGLLKLYWGESKVYKTPSNAIKQCLNSLAPFLNQPQSEDAERERDLVLLSDKADLSDKNLTEALRKYFDKTSVMSNKVRYCGIALIGFDCKCYDSEGLGAISQLVQNDAKKEFLKWKANISENVIESKLENFELQFLCIPLPSADGFRQAFMKAMGLGK